MVEKDCGSFDATRDGKDSKTLRGGGRRHQLVDLFGRGFVEEGVKIKIKKSLINVVGLEAVCPQGRIFFGRWGVPSLPLLLEDRDEVAEVDRALLEKWGLLPADGGRQAGSEQV